MRFCLNKSIQRETSASRIYFSKPAQASEVARAIKATSLLQSQPNWMGNSENVPLIKQCTRAEAASWTIWGLKIVSTGRLDALK